MQLTPLDRYNAYKYCRRELGWKKSRIGTFELEWAHLILQEIENYRRAA